MLVALFTAILAGALAYAVISIALLTLSWLKNRIVERLKKAPVGITFWIRRRKSALTISAPISKRKIS